jgi:hypothetical protein
VGMIKERLEDMEIMFPTLRFPYATMLREIASDRIRLEVLFYGWCIHDESSG